jgi:hypothetical protein
MKNEIMRTIDRKPVARRLPLVAGLAVLLLLGYTQRSFAEKSAPKSFSSPAEACHALHQALRSGDEKELEAILGAGKEVTTVGDHAEDKQEREHFIQKYQEMHRLVKEPDGTTVLYIGAENWPFPIPLVAKNGRWYFDSQTGRQEILFRRVGENEAAAIQVCRTLPTFKNQPKVSADDDPISQYAHRIATSNSTTSDTSARATLEQKPFHGYYFRTLKGQQGPAVVAYPAEYRSSGVLTFMLTPTGLYERDLGPNTTRLARNIKEQPGSGWALVK